MKLNITYVKSKMTYITGMCLRKSFNLLRGREGCWLYGVYEIDINHTCVKVFKFLFFSKFRVSRLTFIESQPRDTELGGL